MIEQFIDPKTNRFQPRLGFTLVKSPTRKNFLQRYLLVFPDWPLIRLKKSKNTMRVLVSCFIICCFKISNIFNEQIFRYSESIRRSPLLYWTLTGKCACCVFRMERLGVTVLRLIARSTSTLTSGSTAAIQIDFRHFKAAIR